MPGIESKKKRKAGIDVSDETARPKQEELEIEAEAPVASDLPKKKKKKSVVAPVEDDASIDGVAPDGAEHATGEESRKKKKKKTKHVAEDVEPEAAAGPEPVEIAEDVVSEPKKKKKKNKQKDVAAEEVVDAPVDAATPAEETPVESKKSKKVKHAAAENGHGAANGGAPRKQFYVEHASVASMSAQQVDELRESLSITVTDTDCPRPVTALEHCPFPADIVKSLATQGITKPSPIQAQCWPVALQGRDLVGLAETGSGKTLGFLMPAIVHILGQPETNSKRDGPIVVVLAPTRELAIQIEQVCTKTVGSNPRLRSVCAYGGVPKEPQIKALRQGATICIATPGRLIDLLDSEATTLKRVSFLVLDEADRMLDMGFEPQIRRIINQMECSSRQTLMFSATWPKEVQKLAGEFLCDAMKVNIGADRSNKLAANHLVNQVVEVCKEFDKKKKLLALLPKLFKQKTEKILIFMLYKKNCDYLHRELVKAGWPVACIHGDKKQYDRDRVLAEFRSGASPIVIATDVAARGWDVKDVKYVVNYEFPLVIEDYVHRIGRTARAGASGTAYTYFTEENKEFAQELVQILSESKQKIPEELDQWKHIGHRYQKKTASTALYGTGNWTANVSTTKKVHIKFDDDE